MRTNHSLDRRLKDALAAGRLTIPASPSERECLKSRVRAGSVVMPYPGAFAPAAPYERLSPRMKSRALLRAVHQIHPNWTFCLYSAAVAHGLQVPEALLRPICVGALRGKNWRKTEGLVKTHTLREGTTCIADGLPCTDIYATLLDCLCAASFRHGLAIADSALHHGLVTGDCLVRYFEEFGKNRRGIVQARETLSYADGRSENGGESVVRAIIIELGFQVPELQVEIEDPMRPGSFKRVDYYWLLPDGTVVIGELDGLDKYLGRTSPSERLAERNVLSAVHAMRAERRRESHLNLAGAKVLRFSYADALDTEGFYRLLASAGVPLR